MDALRTAARRRLRLFTRRDIVSDAVELVRSDVLCHGWHGVGLQDVVVLHLPFVLEVAGAWASVLRRFRS